MPETGTTRWESTKQWAKKRSPTITRGSTAVMVAAFIASSDTIYGVINDGIAGKPMNHWVGVKILFIMALAAAHNFSTYTDDTHSESKRNDAPPVVIPPKVDPEGHLK